MQQGGLQMYGLQSPFGYEFEFFLFFAWRFLSS